MKLVGLAYFFSVNYFHIRIVFFSTRLHALSVASQHHHKPFCQYPELSHLAQLFIDKTRSLPQHAQAFFTTQPMLDMFLRIYMCTGALFILSLLCMAIFIAFLLSTYLIIYLPTFLTIYAFRVLKVWPLRVTRIVLICPRCERRNFQTFNGFFYMFPAECILIIVARTTSEQWPQVPKC